MPWQTKVQCLKCVQALFLSVLWGLGSTLLSWHTLPTHTSDTSSCLACCLLATLGHTLHSVRTWERLCGTASHTYSLTLIPLIKEAWPITQCQSGPASRFPALTVLTASPMQPGSPSGGIIQLPPLNNSVPALECITQAISDNIICSFEQFFFI